MTKNGVQMAITRYNELLHKVVMNRVKNQSFIEKYIQWKKNKESEKFRNQIERKEKLPDAKFLNFYDPENLNEESFIAEDKEKEKMTGKVLIWKMIRAMNVKQMLMKLKNE